MTPLRITHTPAEGTRLQGADPEGAAAEVLAGAGWKRRGSGWHLPRSVAHTPRLPVIRGTVARLAQVGVDVELELGGSPVGQERSQLQHIPDRPLLLERRLRHLEARRRRVARSISGHTNQRGREIPPASGATKVQLERELNDIDQELEQCQRKAAELIEQGQSAGITRDQVRNGDEVQHAGRWLRAIRVTRHTVTTQTASGGYRRLAYAEFTAVRTPAEALRGERVGA